MDQCVRTLRNESEDDNNECKRKNRNRPVQVYESELQPLSSVTSTLTYTP